MLSRAVGPSDVSVVILISEFVGCGREQNVEFSLSPVMSMQVLCFLQDVINESGVAQFSTLSAFERHLQSYVGDDTEFLQRVSRRSHFNSLDDLLGIVDDLSSIIASPVDSSPNGAVSPTMISVDSYLGMFLRSFVVEVELMSFEVLCHLFGDIVKYQNREPVAKAADDADEYRETLTVNMYSCNGPDSTTNQLKEAQSAVRKSNYHAAETLIHEYFDVYGPSRERKSVSRTNSISLSKGPGNSRRHQQAMLNLASVATQTGNLKQGLTAVEEAMKISHQRGDHASVAEALLLLHYVIKGLEAGQKGAGTLDGSSLAVTPESILVRCLRQCMTIRSHQLLLQATVLFVKHCCDEGTSSFGELASVSPGSLTEDGTNRALWNLVLSASSGDFDTLFSQLKRLGIYPSDHSKESAAVTPSSDLRNTSECSLMTEQVAFTAAQLWLRLGFPGMAELQCRRAIRQLVNSKSYASPYVIGDVSAMLVSLGVTLRCSGVVMRRHVQRTYPSFNSIECARLYSPFNVGNELLRRTRNLFDGYTSYAALREVDGSALLLSVLSNSDPEGALKESRSYLQLHSPVDQSKDAVFPAVIRGKLLLALILSLTDVKKCESLLLEVEEMSAGSGVRYGLELAQLLRASVMAMMDGASGGKGMSMAFLLMHSAASSAGGQGLAAVAVVFEKVMRGEPAARVFEYLMNLICTIYL